MQRTEDRLIAQCARSKIDRPRAVIISDLLQQDLDWTYIIAVARRNRIVPLIYHSVSSIGDTLVGKEVIGLFKAEYLQNLQFNLLLEVELLKILRLFEENSI